MGVFLREQLVATWPGRTVFSGMSRVSGQISPCQRRAHPLFSSAPSMQKTKKSVAKRFKLTATGKLVRRTPGFRHLLAAKSTKQKRRASKDKLVAEGHAKPLKRCLPFGL
jgi:large subunit ribosomal protein L35